MAVKLTWNHVDEGALVLEPDGVGDEADVDPGIHLTRVLNGQTIQIEILTLVDVLRRIQNTELGRLAQVEHLRLLLRPQRTQILLLQLPQPLDRGLGGRADLALQHRGHALLHGRVVGPARQVRVLRTLLHLEGEVPLRPAELVLRHARVHPAVLQDEVLYGEDVPALAAGGGGGGQSAAEAAAVLEPPHVWFGFPQSLASEAEDLACLLGDGWAGGEGGLGEDGRGHGLEFGGVQVWEVGRVWKSRWIEFSYGDMTH